MQAVSLVIAVLVSLSPCGPAVRPSGRVDLATPVRAVETSLPPLAQILVDRPDLPTPRQGPIVLGLQETGIDEEDSDSLEKPLALARTVLDFDLSRRALPTSGPTFHRAITRTMTARLSLRC
jgi:hypothetical protein